MQRTRPARAIARAERRANGHRSAS